MSRATVYFHGAQEQGVHTLVLAGSEGKQRCLFRFKGSKLVGGRDVVRAGRVIDLLRAAESRGGKVDT